MIIQLENVTKSFGSELVLEQISVQIDDHQRVGLIGANGAGKSTLLNLIYSQLDPDSGVIARGSGKEFGFLRQNSGLVLSHTIQEEMRLVFAPLLAMEQTLRADEQQMATIDPTTAEYEEIAKRYAGMQGQFELAEGYQIASKIATVLTGMGFGETDPSTKIEVLSGGERTRLALCKLLLESPDLLILDEPTNHLDFPTLLWLEDYLASYRGALLIVSHDRYFLNRLCDTIWEVEHHHLESYKGNYTRYLVQKEERQALHHKEYAKQQEEIAKLKDFVARNLVRASTTKRAQSRQKVLEKMVVIPAPKAPPKPPNIRFQVGREPVSDVLIIEDLALSVGEPPKALFSGVNLHVKRGEKIALVGHNGIGKSSMLKALLGKMPKDSGRIVWGRNTDVSYFEQGEGEMHPEKTVLNELWDDFPREVEHTMRSVLGQAGLRGEDVFKKVSSLSGGERARLKFAKLMQMGGNVLLLDEPTNHLDLPTKEVLDQALMEYEGTLLVVSHDRYLLNKFPDKMIEMEEDGITTYPGRYDDYAEKKKAEDALGAPTTKDTAPLVETPPPAAKSGSSSYRSKEQRQRAAWRRTRLSQLETGIFGLEEELAVLEQEIQQPEIVADYQQLEQRYTRMEELRGELTTQMQEWADLGEEDSQED